MRRGKLIWILFFCSGLAHGQNGCFQFTSRLYNIIPNPSFELNSGNCNSGYFDQFGMKIPSWTTATDMLLTGYLNACTLFLVPDTTVIKASALNPFVAMFPLVPQPIPDGNGVAAVSDYGFARGTVHVYPKYASFVSTCLPTALEKDSLFRLEFYVGFGKHGDESLISAHNVELLPQVSSTPEKFSLFGLQYCPDGPAPILGCPAVAGWYTLGSVMVQGPQDSWVKTAINFKAPDNIIAIALGPSCDTSYSTTQGDFNFKGRNIQTDNYAYFLDNLQLRKANVPQPMIVQEGSSCNSTVKLALETSFYLSGFQIQWFKDGKLIPNESGTSIGLVRANHDEGLYQCLVQNDSVCLYSDSLRVSWLNTPGANALGAPDTLACSGDQVMLQPMSDTSFRFTWQDGSTYPYFLATQAGTYTVTISNECASVQAMKTVQFGNCNYNVYLPNAFTPNGDGVNDVFKAKYSYPPAHFKLVIYNRFGQGIFSSSDPAAGWDGRYHEVMQAPGTYIWDLEYLDHQNVQHSAKGTVTLIR